MKNPLIDRKKLSARTFNVLLQNDIIYVRQLLNYRWYQFPLCNLGKKSELELREYIKEFLL
jgi:hypothetical protein